ncbi:hypothetical protein D3C75_914230 [compost metagenome]
MGHGRLRRRAVPVFDVFRDADDIALVHFLDLLAPHLDPTAPLGDDQRLAERMGVPGCARTWLEGHSSTAYAGRLTAGKRRIDPHLTGKIVFWTRTGGLGTVALNFHLLLRFGQSSRR